MRSRKKSRAMRFLKDVARRPLTTGGLLESIRLGEEMSQAAVARKLRMSASHRDEGLQEDDRVPLAPLPVGGDLPRHLPEQVGGEVRDVHRGQEAAIVGEEAQVLPAGRGRPANEAIPGAEVPQRRGPGQAGDRARIRKRRSDSSGKAGGITRAGPSKGPDRARRPDGNRVSVLLCVQSVDPDALQPSKAQAPSRNCQTLGSPPAKPGAYLRAGYRSRDQDGDSAPAVQGARSAPSHARFRRYAPRRHAASRHPERSARRCPCRYPSPFKPLEAFAP